MPSSSTNRKPVALYARNVVQLLQSMGDLVTAVDKAADTGNSQSAAYRQGVLDSIEIVSQMWLAACLITSGQNRNLEAEVSE